MIVGVLIESFLTLVLQRRPGRRHFGQFRKETGPQGHPRSRTRQHDDGGLVLPSTILIYHPDSWSKLETGYVTEANREPRVVCREKVKLESPDGPNAQKKRVCTLERRLRLLPLTFSQHGDNTTACRTSVKPASECWRSVLFGRANR